MTYITLGRSGLKVSQACLGSMNFGTSGAPCDEPEARRIVDAFLDAGNNFIDPANVYTGGQSEEIRVRRWQKIAMQSRLKIPLLFGQDVIHGYKITFPIPLAEACSWDMEAIKLSARIAATEASASGIKIGRASC